MKNVCGKCLPAVVLAVFVSFPYLQGRADTPPFDRYRVILDRKPFGEPPPEPKPEPKPIPPSQSFARTLRLTMIVKDEDTGEIRVGVVDQKGNNSMTLGIGDVESGIELVSADYEEEEAVLRKGAEMAVIKLATGDFTPLNASQQEQYRNNASGRQGPGRAVNSRRQSQRQPARRSEPPKPKYTGEELRQHLQDYQMEVIRKGLPPLPIPLTEEQDDQLVREGVLPPGP